jgi:hypothetical protein
MIHKVAKTLGPHASLASFEWSKLYDLRNDLFELLLQRLSNNFPDSTSNVNAQLSEQPKLLAIEAPTDRLIVKKGEEIIVLNLDDEDMELGDKLHSIYGYHNEEKPMQLHEESVLHLKFIQIWQEKHQCKIGEWETNLINLMKQNQ